MLVTLLFFSPGTATSQSGQGNAAGLATPWATECIGRTRRGALECSMQQRLMLQETGQFLARFLIRAPADSDTLVYMVHLPLQISLSDGVSLKVDGVPLGSLSFQTCDGSGCYAGGQMSRELIEYMKAGSIMSLSLNESSNSPISLDFSLSGFTKSLSDISK